MTQAAQYRAALRNSLRLLRNLLAGLQGFEPQLSDPESDVLPLDDSPSSPVKYSAAAARVQVRRVARNAHISPLFRHSAPIRRRNAPCPEPARAV
jgi:hypothetical protein